MADAFNVNFSVTDGSAIDPDDYSVFNTDTFVSFPANTATGTTQVVTINIVDDALIEDAETLNITLAFDAVPPVGVNMLDGAAVGTITDNDANGPDQGISVNDFTVNEDAGTAEFVISYTGNTVMDAFNVNYDITDVTTTVDNDYTAVISGNVTFPAGTESGDTQTVILTIIDDVIVEGTETLDITLAFDATPPAGINMLDGNGTGTITDNDSDNDFPGDMTVECDMVPEVPEIVLNAAGCDFTLDFTEVITGQDVGCASDYTITRTWTVTDCVDNVRVHVQTITVQDTQAPTFVEALPEDQTVTCGFVPEADILTAVDNCDSDIEVVFNEETITSEGTDDFMILRTWTATDDCGNVATHEQNIFVLQPELEEIDIDICIEDEAIDLLSFLPEDFDTNGNFDVLEGDVTINGSTFDPIDHLPGEFRIAYSSTDGICKYFAEFTIVINTDCVPCDRSDIEISEAVTVNGDGINDTFEIRGVEFCNFVFDVEIFNRWGDKVFEARDYQNDWAGFAPSGSIGSSGELPSGTYYYIIRATDTDTGNAIDPFNGYIYLGTD